MWSSCACVHTTATTARSPIVSRIGAASGRGRPPSPRWCRRRSRRCSRRPGATVERERAAGDDLVDPHRHQSTTTERRTSPWCILRKRPRPRRGRSPPRRTGRAAVALQVEVDEHREVARGQAVAVPADFRAPPRPKKSMSGRSSASTGRARPPAPRCRRGRARRTPSRRSRGGHGVDHDVGAEPSVSLPDGGHGVALTRVHGVRGPEVLGPRQFRSSTSTAMMVRAPASRAPAIAASPLRRTR